MPFLLGGDSSVGHYRGEEDCSIDPTQPTDSWNRINEREG